MMANMIAGPHVNRYHAVGRRATMTDHIKAAVEEASDGAGFAVRVVSIFVGNPKGRTITLDEGEQNELANYIHNHHVDVIAHSTYSAVPWKGDPDAANFIREEAGVCHAAGIRGLVVHLPKAPIETVMRYIARLYNPLAGNVRIFLETPAVSPKETYYETPQKLAQLFRAIRAELDPNLLHFGLCIDTAHLWTCGIDLSSVDRANEWLDELEDLADVIPHEAIMIHLNDSARALGVGPDTHERLTGGRIWGDYAERLGDSGLAAIVAYSQRHDIPMILERKPKEALQSDYLVLQRI